MRHSCAVQNEFQIGELFFRQFNRNVRGRQCQSREREVGSEVHDGVVLVDSVAPFSFPSLYAAQVRRFRARKPTDRSLRKLYFSLLQSYLTSR